ncbi:phage tail protein [Salmonella enterica]|nr:phage tail protein [Salmonella enterica]
MPFDNLFDAAMSDADSRIIDVMGTTVQVVIAGQTRTIRGVFEEEENLGYASNGVRIEGCSPSLFVKSDEISGLKRLDVIYIGKKVFWVDRIAPDDCGSRHIWLGVGMPPTENRLR